MSYKHDNLTIDDDIKFLKMAVDEGRKGMEKNDGGPFGACIVDNMTKEVLACEHNMVVVNNDPSAHAEITAIRKACEKINNFDLSEGGKRKVTLYTSCWPCPMCMAAIKWARINRVVYSGTDNDAMRIGFDDTAIQFEMRKIYDNQRTQFIYNLLPEFNEELFNDYMKVRESKTHY